jgi:F-type H+-transporting ATPase subunit a
MVKENLAISKQQYFSVIFYLFLTLFFANLVGMLPFAFTITSSFVVTFFLALTHFVAINLIAAVRHQ